MAAGIGERDTLRNLFSWISLATCLVLLSPGCGGEGGGGPATGGPAPGGEDTVAPGDEDVPTQPDLDSLEPGLDTLPDPDTGEITPDLVTTPGPPVTFSLRVTPAKDFYKPGDKVTISGEGEAADGTALEGLPLTAVSVLPVSLATVSGDTVTFNSEGTGKIKASCATNTSLSDEVPISVDAGPPVIKVLTPKRAASLHTSTSQRVTGSIKDLGGIASATLNGAPLSLAPGGAFDVPLPSDHGLNLIEIEATDLAGRTTRHVQSFLLTNKYYPVPEGLSSLAFVPWGIVARLDKNAFIGASGPTFTSLSHLIQEFLLLLDLAALIPSPAAAQGVAWCTYDIYLSNLSYDPPQVELWPASGGLDLHIEVPDLSADIQAPAPEFACPDLDGALTADAITIDAFAAISLSSGGDLQVSLEEIDVQFVGLYLDLYGIVGQIVQGLMSFFMDDLTEMIEAEFEAQVKAQLEAQLETLLGSVNIDQALAIPPFMPGAPGADIVLHLRPAKVVTATWGMEYSMDASIDGLSPLGMETPGPVARSGCLDGAYSDAETNGDHPMEVALHDDVINQMVFGIWRDGGTNTTQDASSLAALGTNPEELGVEDLVIETTALLPPLLSDCHPDGDLRILLGDMRLDLSATFLGVPLELVVYLYFSAKVHIDVTGPPGDQFVSINYGEMDWALMVLDEINKEWEGKEALFDSLLEETFLPGFLDGLQSYPYGFTVSELPLGDLLPDLGGDFTIVPVVDGFERRTGYSLIKAHVVVQ